MHAQPTTNVTVPSAPTVPSQPRSGRHQAKHPKHEPSASQPLFRLHTAAHEAPATGRVLALNSWAAISIFIGLIPAGHLVAGFLLQISLFPWYAMLAASMGMLGIVLIASAFASIHRARLPWALMTIATFLLAANVAMVYVIPV